MAKTSKGNKPDFHLAAPGDEARRLYEYFVQKVKAGYAAEKVKDGRFQAMMEVALVNDGPVGDALSPVSGEVLRWDRSHSRRLPSRRRSSTGTRRRRQRRGIRSRSTSLGIRQVGDEMPERKTGTWGWIQLVQVHKAWDLHRRLHRGSEQSMSSVVLSRTVELSAQVACLSHQTLWAGATERPAGSPAKQPRDAARQEGQS